jgi:hypothetical protein
MTRAVVLALFALLFAAQPAESSVGKDGSGEVRVAGICVTGAAARLRLKSDDGAIEVRFEIEYARSGVWRLALVHESRVVWKGAARTTRLHRSVEVRRTLPDLPGTDTVTARAWGPRGLTCRATATLAQG